MLSFEQPWIPSVSMDSFDLPTTVLDTSSLDAFALARPDSRIDTTSMIQHKALHGVDRHENRRNFHRKVRTGCATCKSRHVKCDEAKPACRRCTSTGRTCKGYVAPKNGGKSSNVPLLPRRDSKDSQTESESSGSWGSRSPSRSVSPPLTASLGFFVTSDPKEKRFLDMFMQDTLPSIWHIELPRPEKWAKLVMQLIWDEPSVRHSAIALSAAHERQRLIMQKVRSDPSKYAIEYYNKAIGHLVSGPTHDEAQKTRSTIALLTSCLIFVTMEMFLGRDGEVRTHLRSGMRILRNASFATFADEEASLLVANFDALDTHILMYPGGGESAYDHADLEPASPTDATLPLPHFSDLSDAIRSYYSLCSRIQRFQTQLPSNPRFLSTQLELVRALDGWQSAYAALPLDEISSTTSNNTPTMLSISIDTQRLVVLGAHDPMGHDAFVPDVRALLPRLRAAIQAREPAATRFSLDTLSNEMMSLWYLFRICRDPSVRGELRGLLFQALARRGVWCGMSLIVITDRIKALEEGWVAPGSEDAENRKITCAADVPAGARLASVRIDNKNSRHHTKVFYRRQGEVEERTETLELWH